MNIDAVREAFRHELRTLAQPGERLEPLPEVTRCSSEDGERNDVVAFAIDVANVDRTIEAEVERAKKLGKPVEWKVFSFDPPELLERLPAHGFAIEAKEAMLVYDLADGLQPFTSPQLAPVSRIEDFEGIEAYGGVAEKVFGRSQRAMVEYLRRGLQAGSSGIAAYLAFSDGEPAAVGRLDKPSESRFAGLYGGGVLVEHRGKGLYRAVVSARALDAAALGARYLLVDALPTSAPILERLGFVHVAETWPCIYEA